MRFCVKIVSWVFLVALTYLSAQGQSDSLAVELPLPYKYKVTGINMTPLLVQLIPFNRSDPKVTGPYYVTYRRYKGDKAFRLAFGADLSDADEDGVLSHINFRIGWEKRKSIHRRWAYTRGWDFFAAFGDLNIPGDKDTDSARLAFGPTWGVEYNFNQLVGLSVESSLLLGIDAGTGTPVIEFIPPIALYLNFRIAKN